MNFKLSLQGYQKRIESLFQVYLPKEDNGYSDEINEAMLYSLTAGGKRIRPMIVLSVYDMLCSDSKGVVSDAVEAFAVAIEMIHTYSLIHDDLPAMDDDDLRLGKATCHIQFGEDMAILAGDGLLNRSFEIMLEATINYDLGIKGLKAAACLATKSGTRGMIGGQVADISYEGKEIDLEVIGYIHEHKTAALLEAAFMMGAYLAGEEDSNVKKLERVGRCIGLAFQIQDDILDIVSTEETLGKPILSDQKNEKTTYVDIKGIDGSKDVVDQLMGEAMTLIVEVGGDASEFLKTLIEYIRERTY